MNFCPICGAKLNLLGRCSLFNHADADDDPDTVTPAQEAVRDGEWEFEEDEA